jgi:hypothetical protein
VHQVILCHGARLSFLAYGVHGDGLDQAMGTKVGRRTIL